MPPSDDATRTIPVPQDRGDGPAKPNLAADATTAIPVQKPNFAADATTAIPVQKPQDDDSEAATEKLNARGKRRAGKGGKGDDKKDQRRGVSAQELLRREDRI